MGSLRRPDRGGPDTGRLIRRATHREGLELPSQVGSRPTTSYVVVGQVADHEIDAFVLGYAETVVMTLLEPVAPTSPRSSTARTSER